MKTNYSAPSEVQVEAAALFHFLHFMRKASGKDIRMMLDALFAWSKHPEIDGWFITSVQQLCGRPLQDATQKTLPKPKRRQG